MSEYLTIGDLMDKLQDYPHDTPLWFELELPMGIILMLDLEFSGYTSLDGVSHEFHLGFVKSKIYNSKEVNFE